MQKDKQTNKQTETEKNAWLTHFGCQIILTVQKGKKLLTI